MFPCRTSPNGTSNQKVIFIRLFSSTAGVRGKETKGFASPPKQKIREVVNNLHLNIFQDGGDEPRAVKGREGRNLEIYSEIIKILNIFTGGP